VVAVVEGAGADLDSEVIGAGGRVGDCVEGEAGRGLLGLISESGELRGLRCGAYG
jgi:hypothetical protein